MSYNTKQPSEVASALRTIRAVRLCLEDLREHGQMGVTLWAVAAIMEDHTGLDLGADALLTDMAAPGAAAA